MPGSRPELFPKAFAGGADAISFDLEDAVVPASKDQARRDVVAGLTGLVNDSDKVVIVRVNALSTDHFSADVAALAGVGADIINLPKVETRDDILRALDKISRTESLAGSAHQANILANIETPKGLRLALEIATADSRVIGLQLGFTDFSLACGIHPQDKTALNAVRVAIRFASAEAGIACYDGAFPDVKDVDAFRRECEEARNLGFAGKSCIHPSQVVIANDVFAPTAHEVARAVAIIDAASKATESGMGAFLHEGEMIDIPIVVRAQAVVALAEKLGLTTTARPGS